MRSLHRRTFVLGGLAIAGTALTGVSAFAAVPYPFKLGVASGDPDSDSVVLWTRLAPTPLNADGQGGMANADVVVEWQVSTSSSFSSLAASGSVTARYADAHSVHVVAGGLAADADYYYRFRAQGHISPVGRTRTAPAPTAFGRDLVMAFASCSRGDGWKVAPSRGDHEPMARLGGVSAARPHDHPGCRCPRDAAPAPRG